MSDFVIELIANCVPKNCTCNIMLVNVLSCLVLNRINHLMNN